MNAIFKDDKILAKPTKRRRIHTVQRVVVTGIGIVSAIGIGKTAFWQSCVAGKNGISRVEGFETSQYQTNIGGEIKEFCPYIKNEPLSELGRCSQYAVSAARMAYDDAGFTENIKNNCSVFMGTTMGEGQELEKIVHRRLDRDYNEAKKYIPLFPVHNIAASISRELGLNGEVSVIPNACSAGNFAIISAYEKIRKGKSDCAFAGGADVLSKNAFAGFSKLRSLAKEKCQPFDKNRKGLVIGEGAGMLFLETMTSAVKRGAHIYAEIIGWGASCDAYHMITPRPDAKGIKAAMRQAIETSGISYDEVDYISAHGTGTPANDKVESLAINELFGRGTAVSSIKSMLGHSMGAASAIEAAVCCLAIKNSIVPPTINFTESDEDCPIDCVPNTARKMKVRTAVNNAYAFGGGNTCVLFREVR